MAIIFTIQAFKLLLLVGWTDKFYLKRLDLKITAEIREPCQLMFLVSMLFLVISYCSLIAISAKRPIVKMIMISIFFSMIVL